jgi:predicted neuraminidase
MKLTARAIASAIGLCLLTASARQLPTVAISPDITKEFIFTSAPFPSSHASTVVQLKSGDLMAAWFGGTAEGEPDVAIWSAVRTARGWSRPVELAREPDTPCWNPVLFHSNDGLLWLYYKFGPNPSSWTGARRWSNDEGRTWSPVEHLPAGILGPIREKPLVEPNGTIVSGSSVESYHAWAAWIERSTDNGRTWVKHGPLVAPFPSPSSATPANPDATNGIIQPVVIAIGNHHLRMYARATTNIEHIVVADSNDDGVTWSATRSLDLPNPNSGIDAVRLRDGRIILIYNDTTHGRTPLNLAISTDGEHFHNFATLENTPGEYSYPAIIQQRDGSLSATWTWQRTRIRYAHIPLSAIPLE